MRIADKIIEILKDNNVKYSYGIPTSTCSGVNHAIVDSGIEFFINRNEAGASYSAARYSDLTGELGVCFLGAGVGVNNAMGGIADAQRNKLPTLVFIEYVCPTIPAPGVIGVAERDTIVLERFDHSI